MALGDSWPVTVLCGGFWCMWGELNLSCSCAGFHLCASFKQQTANMALLIIQSDLLRESLYIKSHLNNNISWWSRQLRCIRLDDWDPCLFPGLRNPKSLNVRSDWNLKTPTKTTKKNHKHKAIMSVMDPLAPSVWSALVLVTWETPWPTWEMPWGMPCRSDKGVW